MYHFRLLLPLFFFLGCTGPDATQVGDAVVGEGDAGAPHPAPGPPELVVEPGTGVMISGTFVYAGTQAGAYRVDILKPGESNNPTLLKAITLPAQGAWEFEMPKNYGVIQVNGFIDVGQKGPGHGEPTATVKDLTVAETPLTGIALVLEDGAGTEPGAPSTPPPSDAAPAEGSSAAPGAPGGDPAGGTPAAGGPEGGSPAGGSPAGGSPAPAEAGAPGGAAVPEAVPEAAPAPATP